MPPGLCHMNGVLSTYRMPKTDLVRNVIEMSHDLTGKGVRWKLGCWNIQQGHRPSIPKEVTVWTKITKPTQKFNTIRRWPDFPLIHLIWADLNLFVLKNVAKYSVFLWGVTWVVWSYKRLLIFNESSSKMTDFAKGVYSMFHTSRSSTWIL